VSMATAAVSKRSFFIGSPDLIAVAIRWPARV
jgi:hypothetical protein